jgi:hypothetical protein
MRRSARDDLRLAVRCLPRHTRVAMLEGIRDNDIIVGAYVDRRGGVCPMLAAHRNGGRTDFLAFALAWDRFSRARKPRRATERELATLEGLLRAAAAVDEDAALGEAIADHQRVARDRRAREARDAVAIGWGWLGEAAVELDSGDPARPDAGGDHRERGDDVDRPARVDEHAAQTAQRTPAGARSVA